MSRPHPLSITFPADKPVYPMRLTAFSGSDVALDLVVVADGRAKTPGLTAEFSDTFHLQTVRTTHPYIETRPFNTQVGHPDVASMAWDGACLTKFSNVLRPKDMKRDFTFRLSRPSRYQRHVYSRQGARQTGLVWALILWCVGAPAVVVASWHSLAGEPKWRRRVCVGYLAVALVAALAFGVIYLALPKIAVTTGKHLRFYHVSPRYQAIMEAAFEFGEKGDLSLDEARQFVGAYLEAKANDVSGGPIIEEDSPFNYTLHEDADGVFIRSYDADGSPDDLRFPAPRGDGP